MASVNAMARHATPTAPTRSAEPPPPLVTVVRAIAITTVGVLPGFLTGGVALQIRTELGFGIAALGLAVTLFFASSALGSALLGRLVERTGPRRSMRAAALMSATALLGIGFIAHSWPTLLPFLVLGGLANATANPAANLLVAAAVPAHRQGLAFGVKQAAIPTATLLSGLATPLVALTVGWRFAFLGAAALALVVAVLAPMETPPVTRLAGQLPGSRRAPVPVLLLFALGLGFGSAAAVPLGSFLVESGVAVGLAEGAAGTLLAVGSAVNIAVRLVVGRVADHRQGGHLRVVAAMLACGVAGFVLLALANSPWVLVPAALLAFGAGWGWTGLFNFAVVIENRERPAAATGFTQTGAYIGSAIGPLAFGLLAEAVSYQVAWLGSAALALMAVVAMLAARRLILRTRSALSAQLIAPAATSARTTTPSTTR